jgi:MFS family permease
MTETDYSSKPGIVTHSTTPGQSDATIPVQQPSMSPYPQATPPQYPPYHHYHRELDTQRGLKWQSWALMIFIIMSVVSLIMAFVVFFIMNSFTSPSADISSIIGTLVLLLAVLLITFILGILVIVFWLLGYYHVYKGKEEFGQEHTRKVKLSLKLLVAFMVLYLVNIFVGIIFMPFLGLGVTPSMQEVLDRLFLSTMISGIIALVAGIILAFHIVYPVIELLDERFKKRLWIGFALNLAAMVVTFIITIWLISSIYSLVSTLDITNVYTVVSGYTTAASVTAIITIVAYILFLSCYRRASARISEGELKPFQTLPPRYGYQPTYPGYAPGYPPPPR